MRLSEAIRLGAMATTQGTGCASFRSDTAPCALGAARLAAGLVLGESHDDFFHLGEVFPLIHVPVDAPVGETHCGDHVMDVVWKLNDIHCWTREQIADWVEGIEQQQAMPREQPAVVQQP